jgi:SsrA-binding protein
MQATKPQGNIRVLTVNRRALVRYEISDRFEVGVVLVGPEAKSLRAGKMELADAYASVDAGELQLHNAYIAPYAHATLDRPQERRTRKLLARRAEIDRLEGKLSQRGYTLVPLQAYLKDGWVKLELGLGRGRDAVDRREALKARESERETRAALARSRKG